MSIAALAVIGRQNNPLFLQTFSSDVGLKFHFIVHASLDVIEEKVKKKSKGEKLEKYLGLLYPTEDFKVYGYITNTLVKMILVISESSTAKDLDIKYFFDKFHQLFLKVTSNPFYETNSKIESPRFASAVESLALKGL
eukprot:TRINITY_DN2544_c0_g1_i1.p2 TRINITY_DN2544_c0_g1~~TRINITY_DN2544_c0_g1_i1.p2  ORF type:complete len:138 (-),score=29.51 TRINITY_DN2544_c0_g1_i1:11-424(-)